MKEINPVVQKLSPEQSLRPAVAAGAYKTIQKHKVTPGIPGWLNDEKGRKNYLLQMEQQKIKNKKQVHQPLQLSLASPHHCCLVLKGHQPHVKLRHMQFSSLLAPPNLSWLYAVAEWLLGPCRWVRCGCCWLDQWWNQYGSLLARQGHPWHLTSWPGSPQHQSTCIWKWKIKWGWNTMRQIVKDFSE